MLAQSGRALTNVLLFDVPEEELVRRSVRPPRLPVLRQGLPFGLRSAPGGWRLRHVRRRALPARRRQRSDGRKRLAVYRRQTEPLVGYYADHGLLETIYGGGRMPDEVFADVRRLLSGS